VSELVLLEVEELVSMVVMDVAVVFSRGKVSFRGRSFRINLNVALLSQVPS
jgi:hypothetical protein